MDGSNLKTIVQNSGVTAITIDYKEKNIFWAHGNNGIVRANYDGRNGIFLTTSLQSVKSIAFFENKIFWQQPGSIWSCELTPDDKVCKSSKMEPIAVQYSPAIKFYTPINKIHHNFENPCQHNNGNCFHFCHLIPNNRRSCSCQVGFELNPDSKSCRRINYEVSVETRESRNSLSMGFWELLWSAVTFVAKVAWRIFTNNALRIVKLYVNSYAFKIILDIVDSYV